MLKKGSDKENIVDNFMPITLLNADLKIVAKVVAERLAFTIEKLVDRSSKCVLPGRGVHGNLYLMRYIIDMIIKVPGAGGELINLDQMKGFNMVDHHYLDVVVSAADFCPVFRSIHSVVRVNFHLSGPYNIKRWVRQNVLSRRFCMY